MDINATYRCVKEYSDKQNLITGSIKSGDIVDIENVVVGDDYYIFSITDNPDNIKCLGVISEDVIEEYFELEKQSILDDI